MKQKRYIPWISAVVVLGVVGFLLRYRGESHPKEPHSRQEIWYHSGYPGGITGHKGGMSVRMGPSKMPHVFHAIVKRELLPLQQLHVDGYPEAMPPALPIDLSGLQLVHTDRFLHAVLTGEPRSLASSQGLKQWSPAIARGWLLNVGGLYQAASTALTKNIITGNLGHGYHHALPERGSEYCTLNGLAVVAKKLIHNKQARRVLIIDLDQHEGNGTAVSILGDKAIWNVSIYGEYMGGPPSSTNSHMFHVQHELLPEGEDRDINYLAAIASLVPLYIRKHNPDIILYQAGMDPYDGADITEEALAIRDAYIFALARSMNKPITWVLAGGYTRMDTLVRLHTNTIRMANRVLPNVRPNDRVLHNTTTPYKWSYQKGKVSFPDWIGMAQETYGLQVKPTAHFTQKALQLQLQHQRKLFQNQQRPIKELQTSYRALLGLPTSRPVAPKTPKHKKQR